MICDYFLYDFLTWVSEPYAPVELHCHVFFTLTKLAIMLSLCSCLY